MKPAFDAVPLDSMRRALVVNLRHHGDVLLSSPVMSVLRRHAPNCEVDALVYGDSAAMLELHPAISRLHQIDRDWKSRGRLTQLSSEWRLFKALKDRHYDLLIALTPHRRCQWLARALKPRWSVAPHHPGGGPTWRRSFTHIAVRPIATWRHTVEVYLDTLRRIGCHPRLDERKLILVAGDAADARVDALMCERGIDAGRFVHIHPASRWLFKCWPTAHWAALVDALYELGWPSVLTAGPNDAERSLVDGVIASARSPAFNLSGQLSLKELAALTSRARLFVGVDSAPMHIAAAMNTPLIALFGPSGSREWGPWHARARVLTNSDFQCVPCGRDGCAGSKRSECLEQLQVSHVLDAARAELEARYDSSTTPLWMTHVAVPEVARR